MIACMYVYLLNAFVYPVVNLPIVLPLYTKIHAALDKWVKHLFPEYKIYYVTESDTNARVVDIE